MKAKSSPAHVNMLAENNLLCILLLLVCACVELTDTVAVVEVEPAEIIPGVTESLDVNCTFTLDGTSNMAGLVSMAIFRANDSDQSFTELALISEFSPTVVNVMVSENIITAGVLVQSGESYLDLRWEDPMAHQGGVYQCTVQGLDQVGHAVVSNHAAQVVADETNIQNYLDKIFELKNYTKRLEETIELMGKRVSDFEKYTKSLEQDISTSTCVLENLDCSFLTHDNHTYYISTAGFSDINDTVATCNLCGGYLVEIDDAKESQAIKSFLDNISQGRFHLVAISGTDSDQEGVWLLQGTDQPMPYENWGSGRPQNNTEPNCVFLHSAYSWGMGDYSCKEDMVQSYIRYMCEVPHL